MGSILDEKTIPQLNCLAIAGAANNQLKDEASAELIFKRGILYAPDYVINAGGILNVTGELESGGFNPKKTRDRIANIFNTLGEIFIKSKAENRPTHLIADEMAEDKLKRLIGQRKEPIHFGD